MGIILISFVVCSLLAVYTFIHDPTTKIYDGVTIGIEKKLYQQGEPVRFWIYNGRNNELSFVERPPYGILKQTKDKWEVVYNAGILPASKPFPPGANMTWSWGQQVNATSYASPGRYRVIIATFQETFSISFGIIRRSAKQLSSQHSQLAATSGEQAGARDGLAEGEEAINWGEGWNTVYFVNTYDRPVVVMEPVSY